MSGFQSLGIVKISAMEDIMVHMVYAGQRERF